MDRMVVIEDAQAFVRLPKGVYKQVNVYARGERIFVPHSGGFIRVCARLGSDGWSTSHPSVKVIDFDDHPQLSLVSGEPRYRGALKAAA